MKLWKEFGIQGRKGLAMVDAGVLPCPRLIYVINGKVTSEAPGMRKWNVISKILLFNFETLVDLNLDNDCVLKILKAIQSQALT
ncbi:hypothetical protein FNV43_RR19772 [Rhamnella rubrinervis]|uniref:Uncharacterized protein n=1 Tax=Rhamnella rubrinervis TaxID=2594499 RepID=A0A8K0GSR0_9ROSA|nr:hypothetical protein FNV43_RR19772 [Rhamnella rubrinervis]